MKLAVDLVYGLEGLHAIRSDWLDIFANSASRNYYTDWRWHHAIAKHLIPASIAYLIVRSEGAPIAIFPLQTLTRAILGVQLPYLSFPRHADLWISDIVLHKDFTKAPILHAVQQFLRGHTDVAHMPVKLCGAPDESNIFNLCAHGGMTAADSGRLYYLARKPDRSFSSQISRKQAKNTRRYLARAAGKYKEVSLEVLETSQDVESGFRRFTEIESAGWRGENGTKSSIALDSNVMSFYNDVAESFAETLQTRIALLRFGDRYVAGQYGFVVDATLHIVKIGYDEAFRQYAPGNILLGEIMEWAEDRVDEINLTTAPAWADRWHFRSRKTFNFEFHCGSAISRSFVGLNKLRRRVLVSGWQ